MPDSNVRWLVSQRTPLPFTFVHGQVTLLHLITAKVVPWFRRNIPIRAFSLGYDRKDMIEQQVLQKTNTDRDNDPMTIVGTLFNHISINRSWLHTRHQ